METRSNSRHWFNPVGQSIGFQLMQKAAWVLWMALTFAVLASSVRAQSTESAKGLVWLQGQVLSGGQINTEPTSSALPFQVRAAERSSAMKSMQPNAMLHGAIHH